MSNDPNIRRAVSSTESPLPPTPPPATASAPPASKHAAQREHDIDAAEVLLKVYIQKRIEGQLQFYENRIREFEANSGFMVVIGAAIMAISAAISAAGVAQNSPTLAFITALLPAFAALTASMRQLYQWDKQAGLYRDAALGLQEARLVLPDMDLFDRAKATTLLPDLIKTSEDVFTSEINQWGQIALGLDDAGKPATEDDLNRRLRTLAQGRITGSGGADFEDGGVG